MSLTDPQNDIPCRSCETEGPPSMLDDDGLCPGCRTPAARLVAALCEMGVAGDHIIKIDDETVEVGALTVDVWEDGAFTIHADGHYSVMAGHTAANAIAAIVQAPGLRAERDALAAEVKRLTDRLEVFAGALLSLGAS